MTTTMQADDNYDLYKLVADRPIALLVLGREELEALAESRRGLTEFTITVPHVEVEGVKTPCPCLIFGRMQEALGGNVTRFAYLAVMQSRSAVATLQSRVKFKGTATIYPNSAQALLKLMGKSRFATSFEAYITAGARLSRLPPGLSAEILRTLASDDRNHWGLRSVMLLLRRPKANSREAQQHDAVQTALRAFGLPSDAVAAQLDVLKNSASALGRARVMEDQVIEHDARYVPGYELTDSVTGRATFRKGNQTLEVFTANRTNLEQAFGVDLIYLNSFHSSAVMIQYKMLESHSEAGNPDWVYREDRHLQKQLRAMETFAAKSELCGPYRLCSDTFFFKFPRRTDGGGKLNIIVPISHFREILLDPSMRNNTGGLRLVGRDSGENISGKALSLVFYNLDTSGHMRRRLNI